MNRYQFMKQLGDGTYGSVILATINETGEKVAIKKMKKKYYSWEECLNLREVKSLRKLNHANIVKLKEVIRENDMLYFVFEFMKENLYQMMKDRDRLFPESSVRNITYQVLQGLSFMHKHGFFHRDLKPENLLCNGPDLVKIADFGLAREVRSRPPYTDYVSTRWYRAPEVLLRSTSYNSPIDMWAIGCIMAEVYTLRPLFPGSSEIDQLFKVCAVLGTPSKAEWPEGHKLAAAMNFRWPQTVSTALKQLIPHASQDGIQVMHDLMLWAPEKRPSAQQTLRYNFFRVGQNLGAPKVTTPTRQQAHRPSIVQPAVSPVKPAEPKALPSITNAAKPSPMNKDPFVSSPVKASARKQWNAKPVDSIDAMLDDFDFSDTKKPAAPVVKPQPKPVAPAKKRNSIFNDDFDDDDFFSSTFGPKPGALPKIGATTNNRINSGRSSASSAKQLYMSKSRYMPGKKPLGSGQKDPPGSNWGKQQPLFGVPLNRGTNNPLGAPGFNNSTANTSYVPSFAGSAATNKTTYRAGGWKRAEPAPLALNKHSGSRQAVGALGAGTGRTDWASKYLK